MNEQFNEEQVYEQPTEQGDGQVVEQQEAVSQDAVQGPDSSQETSGQESGQQMRFRDLREARDRAARERDDALRRLQEYESRASTSSPQSHDDEDDLSLDADSLVEGKHLKTVNKRLSSLKSLFNTRRIQP